MYIDNIILENIKSFHGHNQVSFSKSINTIVGINNAGKSTIVQALLMLQYGPGYFTKNVVTVGENTGMIRIGIAEPDNKIYPQINQDTHDSGIYFKWKGKSFPESYQIKNKDLSNAAKVGQIQSDYPNNFIFPHLPNRSKSEYKKNISLILSNRVDLDLNNIYPKIDTLTNSRHASFKLFQEECEQILGIDIGTVLVNEGKEGGLIIDDDNFIPIENMGAGIPKLIGFILDLCVAKNKLFLIEEPENDIHPGALKALLNFIIRKSKNNQFIVTTHSNIVTKYLGSVKNSKLIKLKHQNDRRPPVSTIEEIGNDIFDRKKLLYELGYDMLDYDLWEGYLLFEESSAERIVRDILIPLYYEGLLNKLCTIASNGIDDVEKRFINLHQIMVYVHKLPIYEEKTWVMIDSHPKSEGLRKRLMDNFKSWKKDQFFILTKKNFEEYYPEIFQNEVKRVLEIRGKKERRLEKKKLCDKVVDWNLKNKKEAKTQFLISAKEIIDILQIIDNKI